MCALLIQTGPPGHLTAQDAEELDIPPRLQDSNIFGSWLQKPGKVVNRPEVFGKFCASNPRDKPQTDQQRKAQLMPGPRDGAQEVPHGLFMGVEHLGLGDLQGYGMKIMEKGLRLRKHVGFTVSVTPSGGQTKSSSSKPWADGMWSSRC